MRTEPLFDGTYRHTCQRPGCGRVQLTAAPRAKCLCQFQEQAARPPSLLGKAASFGAAQARWLAAGMPVRSPERILEIFETCCRPCEHFAPGASAGEGSCKLCGCRLQREGGLLNKLKMATESCPKSPPVWGPEVDTAKSSSIPVNA